MGDGSPKECHHPLHARNVHQARNANIPFVIHLCMGMHVAMHLGTSARTDMDTLDIFIIKTYQYVVTDDHASLCRSGPGNMFSHDA